MPAKLLLSTTGDSEISNDASEQSLFSQTVPGGTLGTDSLLILRMISDVLNNTGSSQAPVLRISYGATTLHVGPSFSIPTDVDRRGHMLTMFLGAENATNAQRSMVDSKFGGTNSAAGGVGNGNDHNTSVNRGIAEDSTADKTLAVTVQLPTASTNLAWRRRGVWVEHISSSLPAAVGDGSKLLTFKAPNWQTGDGCLKNTTTESSVWSFTVPGGSIGTGNLLIVRSIASVRNNSGTAQYWQRATFGGSGLFSPTAGTNISASGLRYAAPIEFWIGGAGATNAQRIATNGAVISSLAGAGEGLPGSTGWSATNSTNAMTIDTTTDQTFDLRVDFSAASPELDYRLEAASAHLLKA